MSDDRTKRIKELLAHKNDLKPGSKVTEDQEFQLKGLADRLGDIPDWEALKWYETQPNMKDNEATFTPEMEHVLGIASLINYYTDMDIIKKPNRHVVKIMLGNFGIMLDKYYEDRKAREAKKEKKDGK